MKLRNLLMCMYEDLIAGNLSSILINDRKANLFLIDGYTSREELMKYLNTYGRKNVVLVKRDDVDCKEYSVTVSEL
ncbi:MAG: hypothetical protein J6T10_09860 [Methanobrevibacter sp.]|nr:hypothetical protein [Methanobrevibacter sp.]